jgi:F-type H+-transporting ATPase subunit epsilon
MSTIHVDVVSAEESIFEGEAEFVALPGESGELGIYPQHTPLITRIRPGAVRIKIAGKAEEARKKAEEALANRSADIDYAKAQAELMEAMAQIAAIRKLRGK